MPSADAAYADALRAAFEGAGAPPVAQLDLQLAGHGLRLRYRGAALEARTAPAFDHLAPAPTGAEPSVVIDAWDRSGGGPQPPAPPWDLSRYGTRERVLGLDEREVRAGFDSGHGLLSLYRPGTGHGSFVAADGASVPRWVARMPFRHVLGWWAGEVGLTFVHAAAVGRDGACVLLPGSSGSGKSTTALAAAVGGLDFLCDDLCLLDAAAPRAHAAYGWAKAEADAVARVPGLAGCIVSAEAGQSLLRPPNLVRSAQVVGLALPRIAGGATTTTRPARASEAMFALAPSTLVEGNGAGHGSLGLLGRLARSVPAAHVDLGTDVPGVVAAIDELVGRWSR